MLGEGRRWEKIIIFYYNKRIYDNLIKENHFKIFLCGFVFQSQHEEYFGAGCVVEI